MKPVKLYAVQNYSVRIGWYDMYFYSRDKTLCDDAATQYHEQFGDEYRVVEKPEGFTTVKEHIYR